MTRSKSISLLVAIILCSHLHFVKAQAIRPSIMVMPDRDWCAKNGFVKQIDNMGSVEEQEDYEAALRNTDLVFVIKKVNAQFQDRGFRPVILSEEMAALKQEAAERMVITSKGSGSAIRETMYDKLLRQAKADIIVRVGWEVNRSGYQRSVRYSIEAIDAYTNQAIATNSGAGTPSNNSDLSVIIETAVLSKFDDFAARLQEYFNDLFENGRIVNVNIEVFDSSPVDLESEFGGDELYDVIQNWMQTNSVNGKFNPSGVTETHVRFAQTRIPMIDSEKNVPLDTRSFVRKLQKFLAAPPYNIVSKIYTKGIGNATLYIGDK